MAKKPRLRQVWTVNMCSKDFLNLHGSIFVRFFDHSERQQPRETQF